MPLPSSFEAMEEAMVVVRKYVSDHMHRAWDGNTAALDDAIARAIGYTDRHALAKTGAWPPATSSEEDLESAIKHEMAPFTGGYGTIEDIIDHLLGFPPNSTNASEILRLARPSSSFAMIERGVHPLTDNEGRGGVFLLETPIDGMTGLAKITAHYTDTNTLRIIEYHHGLYDDDGRLAACIWGTAFVSLRLYVSDRQAIYGSDETSDDDVALVTSIVSTHPGFFNEGNGIMHLDGVEVRPDLRGKGLATAVMAEGYRDMRRRYPRITSIGHSPERVRKTQPSHRVESETLKDVEHLVTSILTSITQSMDVPLDIYGQLPPRGRLQTMMDVALVERGGEPGMGTDLSEEELTEIQKRILRGED